MKKSINKLLLILLGLCMLSIFIWFRFIRERLPREIPFNLSTLGLLILVYICISYVYMIIMLIFKLTPKSELLTSVAAKIWLPLETLDDFIKNHVVIRPYYAKVISFLVKRLKEANYTYLYLIFEIFPRMILVSALTIDTFYFHCIFLLYKVLIVVVLILFAKYIKYSFKNIKEQYIIRLEYMVDSIGTDYQDPESDDLYNICVTMLPVRRFIDEQIFAIVYEEKKYTYSPWTSEAYEQTFRNKHKLTSEYIFTPKDYELMYADFYHIMPELILLSTHLEEYELRATFPSIEKKKLIIFSLYLLCWSYILFVSFHTYDPIILWNILDTEEPFSQLSLMIPHC